MLAWIGQQLAAPFKGLLNLANPLPNNVQQITPDLVRGFFEPGPANMIGDKILSTVYSPPYSGPADLDRDGCETPIIRGQYNAMYRQEPSIRAAIRGKVDAISCQEVSVQPFDKTKPIDRLAADFCKWSVEETDHGWDGLFDLMLTPAFINGVSYAEKSLEPKEWPQQHELRVDYVWGLKQCRSLDPYWIRLQLDVFWNVTAVVNLVRGLQYYSPDNVLLYSHNPLYHNPFGQSDIRACYRAANIIQDAYQAWYIATKVYGEPYMVAKTKKDRISILNTVMQALRGSGYAVIDKDDEIEAINLAAATGTSAFGELIKTLREDVFLAVRGAYTPFLEGQGGSGAHNDTEVSEDQANTTELASIKRSCRVIRRQLFPWLVGTNFPKGTGLPFLRLGGTDWDKTTKLIQVVAGAQAAGAKVDQDWFYETTGIVAAEPGKELEPPQQGGGVNASGKTAPRPGLTWNDKTHRWVHQGDTGGGDGDTPSDGGDDGPDQPPQPPAPTQTMSDTAKSTFVARLAAHLVDRAKPGKESGNAAEQMRVSDIKADPERFQFRRGADDDDGTARKLPEEKFDAKKCKPLGVWTDHDNGETYVVDGHHRLAWAERDGAKELPVWRIHADTAEHAKAIGKAANGKAKTKTFADEPARDAHGQFAPKGIHGVHEEWSKATGRTKEALHDAYYNTVGDDPGAKPHRGKVDAARLARRVASAWSDLHDAGGTPEELAPLERAAAHAGLTKVHDAGQVMPFDPATHASDVGIGAGKPVRVKRAGWDRQHEDGRTVEVLRPHVEPHGDVKMSEEWKEEDHPRADDGKFGKGGGKKESSKNPTKPNENKQKTTGKSSEKQSDSGKINSGESGSKTLAKPRAVRGEMSGAKRVGTGKDAKIVLEDGSDSPPHITPGMVPPAWTDVKVSVDPNADVFVTARDDKGRPKTVYNPRFAQLGQDVKFARVKEGVEKAAEMHAENLKNRADPKFKDAADATWLMMEQATRPGSDADTKGHAKLYGQKLDKDNFELGESDKNGIPSVVLHVNGESVPIRDKKARAIIAERVKNGGDLHDSTYWLKSHGATTLEGRNVVEAKDGVRLQFMGKEGVWHDHLIRNPKLAAMLKERKKAAGENGSLFGTDYAAVTKYAKTKLDSGRFTPKDFRTMKATSMALKAIEEMLPPKDEKEYKTAAMEVAKQVSSVLGNEPAQALESYIAPEVFAGWRANLNA